VTQLGPSLSRGRDDVIDNLMALGSIKDRLKVLDEDYLMALRASIDRPYTLRFKVDVGTFIKWPPGFIGPRRVRVRRTAGRVNWFL
jgi:hypothetical protein